MKKGYYDKINFLFIIFLHTIHVYNNTFLVIFLTSSCINEEKA